MKQNLRVSLGAVVLALATLAAVIFAFLNFQQRSRFELVADGIAWLDTDHGVEAWKVGRDSRGGLAGVRRGDHLVERDGVPVKRAGQVPMRLSRAGVWTQVRYMLSRAGQE